MEVNFGLFPNLFTFTIPLFISFYILVKYPIFITSCICKNAYIYSCFMVGFPQILGFPNLQPLQIVAEGSELLNRLFSVFEQVTIKLDKIKTDIIISKTFKLSSVIIP